MASSSEVLTQLFSWLSLIFTIILLSPQAYLNYQRQSTEGLSTALLVAFLAASIIPAAYYVFQSEPVALTISWFGFIVLGIFVLCQVPYYAPLADDKAAVRESAQQRLSKRRREFTWHFVAYNVVSGLCCGFFYCLFVVSAPSASFSWLPSAIGYILPNVLTVLGYLLQLRLIVAKKDASGISVGFMALDVAACGCSVLSIAFDQWDGAAVAPFFVIMSCQLVLAITKFCVYPAKPLNKQYKMERLDEETHTAGEGDDVEDGEEEDEEESDEDGEDETGNETEHTPEEAVEEGLEGQHSEVGHAHFDSSLDSTDEEDEDGRGPEIEFATMPSAHNTDSHD